MKPELSEKNPYYISKHRYYELYHFCLQYPTWFKAYNALDGLAKRPDDLEAIKKSGVNDPTAKTAESALYFKNMMFLVDSCIKILPDDLKQTIFTHVTHGLSYDALNAREIIPYSKDEYYKYYRKFFWYLSQARE